MEPWLTNFAISIGPDGSDVWLSGGISAVAAGGHPYGFNIKRTTNIIRYAMHILSLSSNSICIEAKHLQWLEDQTCPNLCQVIVKSLLKRDMCSFTEESLQ